MPRFANLFHALQDLRAPNDRRHSRRDILVIAFGAILCGGQTGSDMELFGRSKREPLQSFLKPDQGIPSHDTFSRLPGMLDPDAFQPWFVGFMRQFAANAASGGGILAVDGKTLRRSYDRAERRAPLHPVSAWAAEQRLVLGQMAVDDKSNGIAALPQLLEMLTLTGKAVAADAMHCQRQVAQQVIEQDGDYVLALKGNQGNLHDDVRLFLDDPDTSLMSDVQVSKGHGRIETRVASVSADVEWLPAAHNWPGLSAVGKVTAIRQYDGKVREHSRCYLLSESVCGGMVQ